ncbi:uncharacterized protein CIMG_02790 [Coccidioides immitis RS]|uniref:Uncharacterized protein n=1 Tax=Coccidioides immitis (strain RS) TaxID=246410 RepID=J3KM45_COCIM|nr:uncharacterized protein CIMG_02790 [Coccidioides immitis RS]EAS37436.3 hypothetical protein CIMG_02790 [Coccidioides immitis RS]
MVPVAQATRVRQNRNKKFLARATRGSIQGLAEDPKPQASAKPIAKSLRLESTSRLTFVVLAGLRWETRARNSSHADVVRKGNFHRNMHPCVTAAVRPKLCSMPPSERPVRHHWILPLPGYFIPSGTGILGCLIRRTLAGPFILLLLGPIWNIAALQSSGDHRVLLNEIV